MLRRAWRMRRVRAVREMRDMVSFSSLATSPAVREGGSMVCMR